MSAVPPADLILEVTRAADPRRVAQAMRVLDEGGVAAFAESIGKARADDVAPRGEAILAAASGAPARIERTMTPFQKMEGFVLHQFVENMLPRGESLFGKGQSGDLWRSMLAEKIGETLARQGGVGVAAMLARQFPGGARA